MKLARLYERITNIRSNHLHQITHRIVSENQTIVLEDLNVRGILKNRKLAKSIADVSLYEFVRQITYKGEWAGRPLSSWTGGIRRPKLVRIVGS